jgi:hypothetical protein
MLASALEDEETQDRGLVLVVWNYQGMDLGSSWGASTLGTFFDSFWNLWKSIKTSFRIARLHYLTIPPSERDTLYSVKEFDEGDTSVRHHTGSPQECLHALLSVGLPIPALPLQPEREQGRMETVFHHKWVEWRKRTDSYHHQHQYKIILVPNRHDVLFGKQPSGLVNAGNVHFHQLILAAIDEYRYAKPAEQATLRTQMYQSLITTLLGDGSSTTAKCLQPLDTRMGILWEPMDETAAVSKIADALEFVRRQLEQQEADDDIKENDDADAGASQHDDTDDIGAFYVRQCCFMVSCKEGYTVCDSSQLSKGWGQS